MTWLHAVSILVLLCVGTSSDAATIRVGADLRQLELEGQVEFLRDEDGRLSIDDVRSARADDFQTPGATGLNFGFTRAAYWYQFGLDNRGAEQSFAGVIEVGFPPLDFVDLYVFAEGKLIRQLSAGDQRPPGNSGIRHHNYAMAVDVPAGGELQIYLRIQIDGAHQAPLRLWQRDEFYQVSAADNLRFGTFYGVMLVMVIYNLLIFIGSRDRAYLYYLLFVGNLAVLLTNLDGFAFPILYGISPKLVNGSVPVSIALSTIFVPAFVRETLNTRELNPRLHRLLGLAMGIAMLSIVFPFLLPVMESTFVNALLALSTTILVAITIAIQSFQGRRTARVFLGVWGVLIVGIAVKVMEVNGVIPVSFLTIYSMHIGACFLVTLVSLGLADQLARDRHEKFRLRQERAEARAAAQNEFLAKMSHELRTPMNAIIGFTDLALRDRTETRRKEHLAQIDSASRSLLHIINDVLDLSRIEAGKLQLDARPFALPVMMDKVSSLLRPSLAKGVQIKELRSEGVPDVLIGDAMRLEQVLVNLLANAVKFTEQGSVELSVKTLQRNQDGVLLEFEVRDSGIGIPPERIAHLFRPFEQGDQSTTRRFGGSGLGLAICKQLVELMGGTISVESVPDQGSCFRFTLRFAIGDSALVPELEMTREEIAETDAAQRLKGVSVLLVEDNAMNRRLAGEILKDAGVELEMVDDGLKAVEAVQRRHYDIVLMDVQMPVMDGFEATRRIRALDGFDRLPIIAMTANALPQDRAEAAASGMNDFLPKPVDAARVLEMLARWAPAREIQQPMESIEPRLMELQLLASEHDFRAQSLFNTIRAALAIAFGPDRTEQLAQAMDNFDFAHANELIIALLEKTDSRAPSERTS